MPNSSLSVLMRQLTLLIEQLPLILHFIDNSLQQWESPHHVLYRPNTTGSCNTQVKTTGNTNRHILQVDWILTAAPLYFLAMLPAPS